jgi:AcrR family transcriptional regulator
LVLGCDVRFDTLTARSINAFDRRQTADLKSDQIISAASRLFNARGLDGVRLDDVSAAIGASKGAIYHHFRDKTELVERCYERGFEIYDLIMETGVKTGKTPIEQFAIVQHLNTQAQLNTAPPLALQPGLSALAPAMRRTLTRRAQGLNAIARQIISKGMRRGHFHVLDAQIVPQVLAGYFTGLAQWMPPDADPVAIADQATNFAAYGLRARQHIVKAPTR